MRRRDDAESGVLDRWYARWSRFITHPRTRSLAAAFPLTRPLVRRRSRELFDIASGFVYSQVLMAGIRSGLFPLLRERPMTPARIAAELGLLPGHLEPFLEAGAALGLLRQVGDRYGLGPLGWPLVDNAGLRRMLEHQTLLYDDLREPLALLRRGSRDTRLGRYWRYATDPEPAGLDARFVRDYSSLMTASNDLVREEVLARLPLDRYRGVLDVGGGEGGFLREVGRRYAHIELTLFDLPAVVEGARFPPGWTDRIRVVGGDFLSHPLPRGADLVTLLRVLHDLDDPEARSLLEAARACLPAGGTIAIAEPMRARGAERVSDVYFPIYFLAMGRGRVRSPREIRDMLRAAGFRRARTFVGRIPVQSSLITARV